MCLQGAAQGCVLETWSGRCTELLKSMQGTSELKQGSAGSDAGGSLANK